jgi:hypothetical protein
MTNKDAFDLWWEWAEKPLDSSLMMTPLTELILLTGIPFIIGIGVGYGLRSYISLMRRSKGQRR